MHRNRFLVSTVLAAAIVVGGARVASAQVTTVAVAEPSPVRIYGQVGVGLVEIGHLELGTFLTPHVSVEGMATWAGVYGPRYGGGAYYTFGHAQGRRPPRHGLLIGARLMLNSSATFDSHGDDLSSYGVIPVGYSFLSDRGVFLRGTVGLAIVRQRTTDDAPTPSTDHHWTAGGPLFTLAAGFAF
jgi:hypothetical protein